MDWKLYTNYLLIVFVLTGKSWAIYFLEFLNNNSGGVIAIFTAIYVLGTFLMWREMRQTRLSVDEPRIQIFLVPRKVRHLDVIDLFIENVGNVPVSDLGLSFMPDDLKNTYGRKMSDVFKKSIKTLGRGGTIKMIMFRDRDWGSVNKIKITAKYVSLYDKSLQRTIDFDFDMQNFNFADMPYEYNNEDFINELRHIKGAIGSLRFSLDEIRGIKAREESERNRIRPIGD